ncbi:MAG: hypothetical protein WCQ50_20960 [Spirochaetota bacterium]
MALLLPFLLSRKPMDGLGPWSFLPFLVLGLAIAVVALVKGSLEGAAAALVVACLNLARYQAIAAWAEALLHKSRGIIPIFIWLALFGVLAALLYGAGLGGFIVWPAAVALSGPLVVVAMSLVKGFSQLSTTLSTAQIAGESRAEGPGGMR